MQGPFPEDLDVPYGTTQPRLILGLIPPVACGLLVLGIAPLYLWGWRKCWVTVLAVLLGHVLTKPIREDADMLQGVAGELQLKDWYE